jgi:hypothetical protein
LNDLTEIQIQIKLRRATSKILELPKSPTTPEFPQPPFDVEDNEIIPPEQVPTDCQGRKLIRYCKEGVHLFGQYYALWDGYYILYKQKVYPVIHIDRWWYIFQKLRNPTTKKWEGGIATRLALTIFQLNPDLDPFEGDLLRMRVI